MEKSNLKKYFYSRRQNIHFIDFSVFKFRFHQFLVFAKWVFSDIRFVLDEKSNDLWNENGINRFGKRVALAKWLLHWTKNLSKQVWSPHENAGILSNRTSFRGRILPAPKTETVQKPNHWLSSPLVRSLIGYDFRWDLIWGKRQSDNHSRNRPFFDRDGTGSNLIPSIFFLILMNRVNSRVKGLWPMNNVKP